MTIFSAIRNLTFLARDVFEAALYLIPAPGLSGDDDDADVLAEREARVDVTDPCCFSYPRYGHHQIACPLWAAAQGEDMIAQQKRLPGYVTEPVDDESDTTAEEFDAMWDSADPVDTCGLLGRMPRYPFSYVAHTTTAGGTTTSRFVPVEPEDDCDLGGGFPPAGDDAPTPPDTTRYPQTNGANHTNPSGKCVGCGTCESCLTAGYEKLAADPDQSAYRRRPSGAGSYTDRSLDRITVLLEDIRNLLQHNAPVASASPPTPADATGQQETLGNDPQSVHQRHMRRLLGEDK